MRFNVAAITETTHCSIFWFCSQRQAELHWGSKCPRVSVGLADVQQQSITYHATQRGGNSGGDLNHLRLKVMLVPLQTNEVELTGCVR